MKKITIILLCALMLILCSCVSNKTFKAQEEKVQILQARQNNQDVQLEMINKELANHREKLNDIMVQLNIINQQLPEIDNLKQVTDQSTANIAKLQDQINQINEQVTEVMNSINSLDIRMAQLYTETNDVFDAYSDYLKQMKDAQKNMATKEEVAILIAETSAWSESLVKLFSQVEALSSQLTEQQSLVSELMTLQSKVASSEQENEEIKNEIAKINTTLAEQEHIKQELVAIHQSLLTAQKEIASLQKELNQIQSTQPASSSEVNDLRARVLAISKDLDALTSDLQMVIAQERAAAEKRRIEARDKQYKTALNEYYKGNFEKSILLFEEFLTSYPDSELVPNAHYWIGENYYSAKNYPKALREFQIVVSNFPGHQKAWDAQLKIGLTYYQMNDLKSAYQELMVIKNQNPAYPQMPIVDKYLSKLKDV